MFINLHLLLYIEICTSFDDTSSFGKILKFLFGTMDAEDTEEFVRTNNIEILKKGSLW